MTADPDPTAPPTSPRDGDASVSSSSTQTRFSFYNAQDYLVKSSVAQQQQEESTNPNRFNFYNAQEFQKIVQQQQQNFAAATLGTGQPQQNMQQQLAAGPQQPLLVDGVESTLAGAGAGRLPSSCSSHNPNNTDTTAATVLETKNTASSDLDSVEILRSLQEHELQRLGILGGGGTLEQAYSASQPASLARENEGDSSASNPYEEAIKEALELLRKHRSSGVTSPSTDQSSSPMAVASSTSVAVERTQQRPTALDTTSISTGVAMSRQQQQYLEELVMTPPEADVLLQSRRGWDMDSSTNSSSTSLSNHPNEQRHQVMLSIMATPTAADAQTTVGNNALLGEAYQAEIETRRKQRQERMARYASRLAELKQEHEHGGNGDGDDTSGGAAAAPSSIHGSSVGEPADTELWEDARQQSASPYQSSSAAATAAQTTSPNSASQDDEVQRGIERVLLAILERANNSRGRAAAAYSANASGVRRRQEEEKKSTSEDRHLPHQGMMDPPPIATNMLHTHDSTTATTINALPTDDALLRAMSDLLRQSPSVQGSSVTSGLEDSTTMTTPSAVHQQVRDHHHDFAGAGDASHVTQDSGTLAEVRLVASDPHQELDLMVERIFYQEQQVVEDSSHDDCNDDGMLEEILGSEPATASSNVRQEDDKIERLQQHRALNQKERSKENTTARGDYTDESEDEYTEDGDDEDDEDEGSELDNTSDSYDDEEESETDDGVDRGKTRDVLNGVLGPLSMMAGGTTGVVLEADSSSSDSTPHSSLLDSISHAAMHLVGVTSKDSSHQHRKDKYCSASELEDDEEEEDSSSESDDEARELTRTLCAHIFPVGMPDREKLQSRIPKWDESDPDEPGYRIVRLNSYQLKSVQREYDRSIKEWKKRSSISSGAKSPPVAADDGSFERDLKEAEDLLDREEQRAKAADGNDALSEKSVAGVEALSVVVEVGESSVAVATEEVADSLENFPGIRPAGKGEMGDLEYFHLPIIFKSHVTGFEPTKDLHLEAGNVVAGQYLVEGELGTAAFSTAYRCIDLNSEGDGPDGHEEVCLKVIKNTKDFFDQSLDEIKILELLRQTGKCNENHLLEMKTFFYHREHLIIVTELLRQNLFEFGKFIIDNDEEPYFTIPRLSYITRQTLIAMRFIHSIGLVHSDVKPENILLSSYSRAQVKLIDFGSSCYLTDRQSSYIQSRSYRAPEVVLGLPYSGKIDIWSLGCVVAEMFTGEVTFQNDSVISMLSRIEGICGKTPEHMVEQGRQSAAYFTSCGLLFEKIEKKSSMESEDNSVADVDDRHITSSYDIFQPRRTTLAARLGFENDLMTLFDNGKPMSREQRKQAIFVDFVRSLLTIDPDLRPTAAEALKHPWMEFAASLTEQDIKYPSE